MMDYAKQIADTLRQNCKEYGVSEAVAECLVSAIASVPCPEPITWDEIEKTANDRYKVVPSDKSMFWRFAVVAGDGTQQLYIWREMECRAMADKFIGAFLDGAFLHQKLCATASDVRRSMLLSKEQIYRLDELASKASVVGVEQLAYARRFIAAADPKTIQELIAMLRESQLQEISTIGQLQEALETIASLKQKVFDLQTENSCLRREAKEL